MKHLKNWDILTVAQHVRRTPVLHVFYAILVSFFSVLQALHNKVILTISKSESVTLVA